MSTTSAEFASSPSMSGSRMPTRAGLIVWVRAMTKAYRTSRERRAAVTALSGLDDHLLRDIGIDRSDIMSVVQGRSFDMSRRARS